MAEVYYFENGLATDEAQDIREDLLVSRTPSAKQFERFYLHVGSDELDGVEGDTEALKRIQQRWSADYGETVDVVEDGEIRPLFDFDAVIVNGTLYFLGTAGWLEAEFAPKEN